VSGGLTALVFQEVVMVHVSPAGSMRTAAGSWTGSVGRVRTGGVAAVLAGLVMGVHEWWDDRVPGVQEGVVPSALHSTWVGLMCVGFLGLSALQWHAFGPLGRLASRLVVVGSGSLFVLAVNETWGYTRSDVPHGDPSLPFLVLMFAVFGCYVAGLLLFSLATAWAGVLPRAGGVFLLTSVLLKLFASGVLPGTLALMGAAMATVGLSALWVVRSPRNVRVEPAGSA
jgi:drug/metabolite transporter superfamily protein YnfA